MPHSAHACHITDKSKRTQVCICNAVQRFIKVVSISSCVLTLSAAPFLVFFGDETIEFSARVALACGVAGFGSFSTFMVWWATKPYIERLECVSADPDDQYNKQLTAYTNTLLGREQEAHFSLKQCVKKSGVHPYALFEANGVGYHIHPDHITDPDVKTYIKNAVGWID